MATNRLIPTGGVGIDDLSIANNTVWSSEKTNNEINKELSIVTKTSPYTLIDDDDIVNVTGTTTITLHSVVTAKKKRYDIRNKGVNIVTIICTGAETLNGETILLLESKESVSLVPDDEWIII